MLRGRHRQHVAAFVFDVAGMASDPDEFDLVLFAQIQQLLPQVRIDGLVFLVSHPAIGFPFCGPAFFNRVDGLASCADALGQFSPFVTRPPLGGGGPLGGPRG